MRAAANTDRVRPVQAELHNFQVTGLYRVYNNMWGQLQEWIGYIEMMMKILKVYPI